MFLLNHLQFHHLVSLSATDFFSAFESRVFKKEISLVDMPHNVHLINPKGLFHSLIETTLQCTVCLIYLCSTLAFC